MVPLFASHRQEVTAHILRLRLDEYARLHCVIAWTTFADVLIHGIMAFLQTATWQSLQTFRWIFVSVGLNDVFHPKLFSSTGDAD